MKVIEDSRIAHPLALRPGTLLEDRYRIIRLISGSSPFAITYLARDRVTGQDLALKELLPRMHVSRPGPGPAIRPHTPEDERVFHRLQRAFAREAELLAELRHPNLPRVRAHFESHRTGCFAADLHEGVPLVDFLASAGGRLSAESAVVLVSGVLDALQALHAEGVLHGHVTPDNIRVTPDLQPVLVGIGTTRHVLGNAKEPAAAYAPIEQYASSEVGPWTDVHACGALLYTLLVGAAPPTAIERAAGRPLAIPPHVAATLPQSLVRAITAALAPLPANRPHSAMELRRRIEGAAAVEPGAAPAPAAAKPPLRLIVPSRHGLLADDAAAAGPAGGSWFDIDEFEEPPAHEPWSTRLRGTLAAVLAAIAPGRWVQALKGRSAATIVLALLLLVSGSIASVAAIVRHGTPQASAGDRDAPAPRSATVRPVQRGAMAPPAEPRDASSTSRRDTAPSPTVAPVTESRVGIELAGGTGVPVVATRRDPAPPSRPAPEFRVSVPAASAVPAALSGGGAPATLPFDAQADLRERIAQGALKAEFGDYVGALRVYRAAADRVAALGRTYPSSPVLAAARRDLEQATARTRRACLAESAILEARSGGGLQCG